MIKATLVKVNSRHTRLRSPSVEGQCEELPKIGHPFTLWGQCQFENYDDPSRGLTTSPVTAVREIEEGLEFATRNSIYRLINIKANANESAAPDGHAQGANESNG